MGLSEGPAAGTGGPGAQRGVGWPLPDRPQLRDSKKPHPETGRNDGCQAQHPPTTELALRPSSSLKAPFQWTLQAAFPNPSDLLAPLSGCQASAGLGPQGGDSQRLWRGKLSTVISVILRRLGSWPRPALLPAPHSPAPAGCARPAGSAWLGKQDVLKCPQVAGSWSLSLLLLLSSTEPEPVPVIVRMRPVTYLSWDCPWPLLSLLLGLRHL